MRALYSGSGWYITSAFEQLTSLRIRDAAAVPAFQSCCEPNPSPADCKYDQCVFTDARKLQQGIPVRIGK